MTDKQLIANQKLAIDIYKDAIANYKEALKIQTKTIEGYEKLFASFTDDKETS